MSERSDMHKAAPIAGKVTMAISSDDLFGVFRRPIVYALVRGSRFMYVGASLEGLSRPLSARHHKLRDAAKGDRILVWAVQELWIWEIERSLIAEIRPPWNGPLPGIKANDSPRRKAGSGSIWLRGKVWWIAYRDGAKKRESSRSSDRSVAEALLAERIIQTRERKNRRVLDRIVGKVS